RRVTRIGRGDAQRPDRRRLATRTRNERAVRARARAIRPPHRPFPGGAAEPCGARRADGRGDGSGGGRHRGGAARSRFARGRGSENPRRRGRRHRRGHRASGARRDRLHPGTPPALLDAAALVLARRIRQRGLLVAPPRRADRGGGRRAPLAGHHRRAVAIMASIENLRFEPPPPHPEAEKLRGEVRAFLAEHLPKRAITSGVGSWGGHDGEFSRKMGARGWIGMTWPKRYGGHERSALERYVVLEEMLAAGAP